MENETIVLNVTLHDKVDNVRIKIPDFDNHWLAFAGKQLEDGHILLDYNVQNRSTIFCVPRLYGSGETSDSNCTVSEETESEED